MASTHMSSRGTHRVLRICRERRAASDPVRDSGDVAGERPSRAYLRRATLNAGMGDVLKIIRCGTISVQRGCDGCDRHPVSAMRAGKEETRQMRWGNVDITHRSFPVPKPPESTPRPI
jgi:hypothetical protein